METLSEDYPMGGIRTVVEEMSERMDRALDLMKHLDKQTGKLSQEAIRQERTS